MFKPEFAWTISYQVYVPSATGEFLNIRLYCGYSTEGSRDTFVTFRLNLFGDDREKEFFVKLPELVRLKQLFDLVLRNDGDLDTKLYRYGEFSIRAEILYSTACLSAAPTLTTAKRRLLTFKPKNIPIVMLNQLTAPQQLSAPLIINTTKRRLLTFRFVKEEQVLEFSMDRFVNDMAVSIERILRIELLMLYPSTVLFDRALAYVFMNQMRHDCNELHSIHMTDDSLKSVIDTGYDKYSHRMRWPMQKICSALAIPLDTLRRFSKITLFTGVRSLLEQDEDTLEGDTFLCIATNL